MNVRELMTTLVHVCRPEESLEAAARLMWEHDCGALPVVGGDGKVVAMVTDRDLCMAAYTRGLPLSALRVEQAMSRAAVVCRADDGIAAAARVMAEQGVRRLPVVDAAGKLVGILGLNDLACAIGELPTKRLDESTGAALRVLVGTSRHRDRVPTVVLPAAPPAVQPVPTVDQNRAKSIEKPTKAGTP